MTLKPKKWLFASLAVSMTLWPSSLPIKASEPPSVVATIKPLHALVAGVMGNDNQVDLLVDGFVSPHDFQPKPSHIQLIQNADIVFYIGDHFETSLVRALELRPETVRTIAFMESPKLNLLSIREGGPWGEHNHDHHKSHHEDEGHDDHDHDEAHHEDEGHDEHDHDEAHHEDEGHDDHDHDDAHHEDEGHDDHGHDEAHHEDEGHDEHDHDEAHHEDAGHDEHDHDEAHHEDEGHDEHDHGMASHDEHVWLSPQNAIQMVGIIADELGALYPDSKALYDQNAKMLIDDLKNLDQQTKTALTKIQDEPFIVFHDAYQYFEKDYGLKNVGAITLDPHESTSISRIKSIRETLKNKGVVCVFREPQFSDRLVETVVEGTTVKRGVLDPLGADLTNGRALYFDMINGLRQSLETCLG